MKINHAVVAVVAVVGLVGGFVSPASAGKPEQDRGHDVFIDEDQDVCGINVDVVVDVRFNDRAFFDADGNFLRFMGTSNGSNTFVNDAGESVMVSFANLFRETESIDEAGLLTLYSSVRGLPEKITSSQGPVLTRDAGLITS